MGKGSLRNVKKIWACVCCFSCVLFTGCNSILYNGNFHFEAYDPPALPGVSIPNDQKVDGDFSNDRFQIGGTDAFFILPDHGDEPDEILTFKVLDYNSENDFVYAYITPYYGSDAVGGSGISKERGNRKDFPKKQEDGEGQKDETKQDGNQNKEPKTDRSVAVLMSYDPQTEDYQVFFSQVIQAPEEREDAQETDSFWKPENPEETLLFAQKMAGDEAYFICVENVARVFDAQGKKLSDVDLNPLLVQQADGRNVDVSILEIMLDNDYNFYVSTLTEDKSDGDVDDNTEADEVEDSMETDLWLIGNLSVGAESDLFFRSDKENWDEQRREWMSVDGQTLSEDDHIPDMDEIRKNTDRFSEFYMESPGFRLLSGRVDSGGFIQFYTHYPKSPYFSGIEMEHEVFFRPPYFLKSWEGQTEYERGLSAVLEKVAEYRWFSSDQRPYLTLETKEGDGVKPDPYDPGKDPDGSGWNQLSYFEEAEGSKNEIWTGRWPFYVLLAERINPTVEQWNSVYANIRIPGRFGTMEDGTYQERPDTYIQPYLEPIGEPDILTRSYEIEYEPEDEDEEGERESVTETVRVYNHYRLVFPEETRIYWMEKVGENEEMVSSGGIFGSIFYRDDSPNTYDDEKSNSSIHYNDGFREVLRDANVPGKAMDVQVRYLGEGTKNPMIIFMTSAGVKFYPMGENGMYTVSSKNFVSYVKFIYAGDYRFTEDAGLYAPKDPDSGYKEPDEDTSKAIQDAVRKTGDGDSYRIENFLPISSGEVIISSLNNGLIFYNLHQGNSAKMKEGSYYTAFMDRNQPGLYQVVGFQTEEYSYKPGDISRAKVYAMDLKAEKQAIEAEALRLYLEDRLQYVIDRRGDLRAEDQELAGSMKRLFYSTSQSEWQSELDSIIRKMGMDPGNEEREKLRSWVREKRKLLADQQSAFASFYSLAGVSRGAQTKTSENNREVDDERTILAMEDRLMDAFYTDQIEVEMVEYALLSSRIAAMPEKTEEEKEKKRAYGREYRPEYLDYQKQLSQSGGQTGGYDKEIGDGIAVIEKPKPDDREQWKKYKEGMRSRSFYQKVLADIQARYEKTAEGKKGASWETYLQQLLEQFSLGEHKPDPWKAAEAVEGLTKAELDENGRTQLSERIHSCRRSLDLEEIIIEKALESASYYGNPFREEFKKYQEKKTKNNQENRKQFEQAGFYQIIRDIQRENGWNQKEWEEEVIRILRLGGALLESQEEGDEPSQTEGTERQSGGEPSQAKSVRESTEGKTTQPKKGKKKGVASE